MKLWTIQNKVAYKKFKDTGILRADKNFIYDDMLFYYSWMSDEMKKRIGLPTSENIEYPIWAWYQWKDDKHKRPDLRCSGHLEKGAKGVLLELEVEEENVLLSDFFAFNSILNHGYIANSEEEFDKFYDELESYGYNHQDLQSTNIKSDILDQFKLKLFQSWEKIFDLERDVDEDWEGKNEDKPIQATMWKLKWEQVVSVKKFISK
ncbi:DUF3841 domain-containing protein [uncultured Clostridium sp.]|uniref:DUF3841 domain-containing protein n=1 Tax=uncultured Clostridium sp. TaxID=59620 RepID=UPI0028E2757F|nr:DUF3841 domain-containing protein [uncultured Clostridium sp.]